MNKTLCEYLNLFKSNNHTQTTELLLLGSFRLPQAIGSHAKLNCSVMSFSLPGHLIYSLCSVRSAFSHFHLQFACSLVHLHTRNSIRKLIITILKSVNILT